MFETRFWMGKSKIKMPGDCGAKNNLHHGHQAKTPAAQVVATLGPGCLLIFSHPANFEKTKSCGPLLRDGELGGWTSSFGQCGSLHGDQCLTIFCWTLLLATGLLDLIIVRHWAFCLAKHSQTDPQGIRCLGVIWSTSGNSPLRRVTAEIWRLIPWRVSHD